MNTFLRNVFFATLCVLALQSCSKENLRDGDLVFVGVPASGASGMAEAIVSSTGQGEVSFVHVAIVEMVDGKPWVVDATPEHGVDRHPLDTLLADFTLPDGSLPVLEVYRLIDRPVKSGPRSRIHPSQRYLRHAKAYLGESYDFHYLPGNGRHYCSELVYDAFADGSSHIFSTVPMNFRAPDGSFPEYWEALFSELGVPIPQNEPGTNPQDMRDEASISELFKRVR